MHFQDRGAYGRIVHLQPVAWRDGWPMIGNDSNNDTIGEPVSEWQKPDVGHSYPLSIPQTSDEFDAGNLGLQWQWHANPSNKWCSLDQNPGSLRLYAVQNLTQNVNLWFVPNLLLQKFPAPSFTATTKISFTPGQIGEKSGLVVMGRQWAFIALAKTQDGLQLGMHKGSYDEGEDKTEQIGSIAVDDKTCFLRVHVEDTGQCIFSYSMDGVDFQQLGDAFPAAAGVWIGAKIGLFCVNPNIADSDGYADCEWFRVE